MSDYGADLGGDALYVGARARSLAQMATLGLSIPPGFVVSQVACRRFLETGDLPPGAWDEVVAELDRATAAFSDKGRPVLFSVRSSPSVEMPGLYDSALYLGASRTAMDSLAAWGGEMFAHKARLGLLKAIGRLRALSPARYVGIVAETVGPTARGDWSAAQVAAIADAYESVIVDESQRAIPEDLHGQLLEAIESVFASWDRLEARRFRRIRGLSDDEGMGAVVHPMLIGEVGDDSGAGIAFSRDPATGERGLAGIYLPGVSRPRSIEKYPGLENLGVLAPQDRDYVENAVTGLEQLRKDMVRIDFVREDRRIWIIEARPADRTPEAAVRVAVDMVDEGLITRDAAILSVDPENIQGMLHPRLATQPAAEPIATGTPAAPGAASGRMVFSAAAAVEAAERGEKVILVRREILPGDLEGVAAATGLIASHGGGTSHAAVAARATGTPAVTGIADVTLSPKSVSFSGTTLTDDDTITIDGGEGTVYAGAHEIDQPPGASYLERLLVWADETRRLGVWANADTAAAATAARAAGADGIGLARSEYMFQGERLAVVRRILLSDDRRQRADALVELENLQVGDFERLLAAMDGTPVVVRLLDPPLHEFLPSRSDVEDEKAERRLRGEATDDLEQLDAAIEQWSEVNPMLGLRGVRLAVVIPEIYRVQVLAALEAVRRRLDAGGDPRLQIMIPLVSSVEELQLVRDMIEEEVHSAGRLLEVAIGTMIELPRAALMADELALKSDFFSFGTNDLTQTTLGISRDDAEEAFLRTYVEHGVMSVNPFQRIDPIGVGRLIELAIDAGRAANPGLEIGVCGEHGGDPVSIAYFHRWGVDYISCSPPRLPIARLAAAQAALRIPEGG